MISIAGEKVRAARVAAGIRSIQAAARATRLNYKTIEAFEGHGDARPPANPKMETLFALAAAYGCSPRDFTKHPEEWDRAVQALGLPATLGRLHEETAPNLAQPIELDAQAIELASKNVESA